MKCNRCGFENLDNARICMGCGQQLRKDQPPPPAPVDASDLDEIRDAVANPPPLGNLFQKTFSVYFSNFGVFFIITALASIPDFVLGYFILTMDPKDMLPEVLIWATIGAVLVSIITTSLSTAALTYGVLQHLRKREVAMGECISTGFLVLISVIAVALAQSLLILFGMVLCIIPGIIIALMYAVAVPVAVEERTEVLGALSRSSFLTSGYRMEVFGVLFLIGLLHFAASFALSFIGTLTGQAIVGQVLGMIEGVFYSGLTATACALIYYRLRCLKESVDIDDLASVFD
jgi:hypothetical protein